MDDLDCDPTCCPSQWMFCSPECEDAYRRERENRATSPEAEPSPARR